MSIVIRFPQYQSDPRAAEAAFTRTFEGEPGVPFSALTEAQAWLKACGFCFAPASNGSPIGLMFGEGWRIAKWRNLTREEIETLHGTITGDQRNGPVKVSIFYTAPAVAIAKVASPSYAIAMLAGAST